MKTLEQLKLFFAQKGYEYGESHKFYQEEYETHFFRKLQDGVTFHLDLQAEQQFEHKFWRAKLGLYYDLEPNNRFMHPAIHIDVFDLLEEHFSNLELYEKKLLVARHAIYETNT